MSKHNYYLLFKPFGYLSQFTKEMPNHKTLADLCKGIPKDVFPVGRLDKDSEGLLLLTNDKRVNHKLLNPNFRHDRTYLAQVEGIPDEAALRKLQNGPEIKVNKKNYKPMACHALLLEEAPNFPERDPPIRVRKSIPDAWIKLTLREGKNRQVRKMCAAIGYPVLRLVRESIEGVNLEGMVLGELKEMEQETFYRKLRL